MEREGSSYGRSRRHVSQQDKEFEYEVPRKKSAKPFRDPRKKEDQTSSSVVSGSVGSGTGRTRKEEVDNTRTGAATGSTFDDAMRPINTYAEDYNDDFDYNFDYARNFSPIRDGDGSNSEEKEEEEDADFDLFENRRGPKKKRTTYDYLEILSLLKDGMTAGSGCSLKDVDFTGCVTVPLLGSKPDNAADTMKMSRIKANCTKYIEHWRSNRVVHPSIWSSTDKKGNGDLADVLAQIVNSDEEQEAKKRGMKPAPAPKIPSHGKSSHEISFCLEAFVVLRLKVTKNGEAFRVADYLSSHGNIVEAKILTLF